MTEDKWNEKGRTGVGWFDEHDEHDDHVLFLFSLSLSSRQIPAHFNVSQNLRSVRKKKGGGGGGGRLSCELTLGSIRVIHTCCKLVYFPLRAPTCECGVSVESLYISAVDRKFPSTSQTRMKDRRGW